MKKLFRANKLPKRISMQVAMILSILLFCLLVSVGQGSSFFYTSHYTKVLTLICIFIAYFAILFYLKATKRLTQENTAVFMIILLGVLLRCAYVLLSGLYDRQHDAGAYTGMGTDFVNPGHIGYIEYIYKFHKLPDINPYERFAYCHPPLYYFLSSLWLKLNIVFGVAEDLAFENLQVLPLLCSCLCMVVTYKILKVLDIKGNGLMIALAFMVFHPATIIMAGSVNNDILTILFMCLIILGSLKWIREKCLKNLLMLALYIGFGMITKLNAAVLAIPLALVFLMHFISVLRGKNISEILKWIKNYCLFAIVVMPIGLFWTLRNLIRFGKIPGFPAPGKDSPMYTASYSLWQRLGIPTLSDWRIDFPFHPISANACHNAWVIMFHTSLFAEEYPTDLTDILLVLCQIVYVLAILLGLSTAVLLVIVLLKKQTLHEDRVLLLAGYILTLLSLAAFATIYPYTCSSDFRYVAICLVYVSIALGLGNKYFLQTPPSSANFLTKAAPWIMHIINYGVIAVLMMIQTIYLFWGRW